MDWCGWARIPFEIKRIAALIAFGGASLVGCGQPNGTWQPAEASLTQTAETAGDGGLSLPIYPQKGLVEAAPFLGSFDVDDRTRDEEYRVQLSRRSDGSIRRTEVRPIVPYLIDLELNSILNYERSRLYFFVTVAGQLKDEPGVVDKPLEEGAAIVPGDAGITVGWTTVERSMEDELSGVAGCPCERLRLASPSGRKQIDVWISNQLQIVLREELTTNGTLQHRYVATEIELIEPDASRFVLPD